MQYLLGFDCGATNIEYKLSDINGNALLHSKLNKSSNLLVSGVEAVSEHINQIIIEIINSHINNDEKPEFAAIVVGAAGAGRKGDADALHSLLTNKLRARTNYKKLAVVSDAAIALEAAFPMQTGSILIAGTGSIIYGKDDSGTVFRTGGYGRIIGDAGSGFSIGKKALTKAAINYDQEIRSSIVKLLYEKFSIHNLDELISAVYKNDFDVASLAEHIISLAQLGEVTSVQILNGATDELILMIRSLMQKMNVKKIDIALSGSLIDKDNYYSKMLRDKISGELKSVTVINKMFNPVDGAIAIAKGFAGG